MFYFPHTLNTPTSVEQLDAACAAEGRFPLWDEALAAREEDYRYDLEGRMMVLRANMAH